MKKEPLKLIPKYIKWIFFWMGAFATLAYRIIIIFNYYSPQWVKLSWYVGTIGFVLYFGYLYHIQRKRVKLIADYDLVNVAKKTKGIKPRQREALLYVVKTISTSKSRWNSLFIFSITFIALIVGIVLDLKGI